MALRSAVSASSFDNSVRLVSLVLVRAGTMRIRCRLDPPVVPSAGLRGIGPELPQDIEAEQAVLGGMLQSQDAITDLSNSRANDFYEPRHQTIFNAILDLYSESADAQLQIDPVLVSNRLNRDGDLERVVVRHTSTLS